MQRKEFGKPIWQSSTNGRSSEELGISTDNNWQVSQKVIDSADKIDRMRKVAEERFGRFLMD